MASASKAVINKEYRNNNFRIVIMPYFMSVTIWGETSCIGRGHGSNGSLSFFGDVNGEPLQLSKR
jgi:hypothetical protein